MGVGVSRASMSREDAMCWSTPPWSAVWHEMLRAAVRTAPQQSARTDFPTWAF